MNKKYDVVLFDLDGTLLDTSEGIYNCVRYTESKMNLKPISDTELRKFVGPPARESYKKAYGLSDEDVELALYYHREYGKTKAIYEAKPYDNMEMCLKELKKANYKLGVATLKLETQAVNILENLNLSQYFDVICGVDSSEKLTKKEVISNACKSIGEGKTVLVGDTLYDLKGALETNIDFIPVLYGFGFTNGDKLNLQTADSPKQILEILLER